VRSKRVAGRIVADVWQGNPGPVTVRVRLLDTTMIDEPALVMAERVFRDVSAEQFLGAGMAFELVARELNPRARYEIEAFVDCDGDTELGRGDYINAQSYPVLTRGYPRQVVVHVTRVG
jgi:hypothetical protein